MSKLMYDFINEDHKRMHNALIAAGWTCENLQQTEEFSGPFWDWVYSKENEYIYFDGDDCEIYHKNTDDKELYLNKKSFSKIAEIIEGELKQPKDFSHIKVGQWVRFIDSNNYRFPGTTVNKWYQRLKAAHEFYEDKGSLYFYYQDDRGCCSYSDAPEDWDLIDIRDTNPNEEIKMQEDQEYYPITKDNIAEVLEYNHIEDFYLTSSIIQLDSLKGLMTVINLDNPNLISIIEAHYGKKLNPIPKDKFDFVQYLLNHGFTKEYSDNFTGDFDGYFIYTKDRVCCISYFKNTKLYKFCGKTIKPTKENADILIAMAKLSEELS